MTSRRREGSSRRAPRQARRLAARILVVCGGQRTEKQYLTALHKVERNPAIAVKVMANVGSPAQVVRYAAKVWSLGDFDAAWAVVDVDDFTDLTEASTESRRNGVHLIVSNPCFELWLLLHLTDHRKTVTTAEAQRLLKATCYGYDKTRLRYADFADGVDDAYARARRLDPGGRAHDHNPSTNMWQVVDVMRARPGRPR